MKFVHVISASTGKDSQATMLLAIKRVGKENCRFVMADTGNEDPKVFEHARYLERELGITIEILRADFSTEIAAKRMFIARDQRVRKRRQKDRDTQGNVIRVRTMAVRWTNKAKRRALAALHPSGNPFLDLCLWKGRFPSRRAQFCTQQLKTLPLVEYQMRLVDEGFGVISWQGVRRDESHKRSDARLFERIGPRLYAFRPIVAWTAQRTVDHSLARGLDVNPLYSEGFDRVGCMPCINCGKKDIKNTARRRPEAIDRIEEWERLVGAVSKRGAASFFPDPSRDAHLDKRGIRNIVRWAHTTRGGKNFDLLDTDDGAGCSSSYGLCDAPTN